MHKPTCSDCGGSNIAIEIHQDPDKSGYKSHSRPKFLYFEFDENRNTLIQFNDLNEITSSPEWIRKVLSDPKVGYVTMCMNCDDRIEMEYTGKNNLDAVIQMFNDYIRDLSITKIVE